MDIAILNAVPFILAILLALPPYRALSSTIRTWVNVGAMATIAVALLGYFPYIQADALSQGAVTRTIEWLPEIGLSLSFYLDGLALVFGLIISGIGAGIALYTGYYFDDDSEGTRFAMWLMAFAGAMLGVVLSGNLITLFILWELTSVTSFMLIGFKGAKDPSARWGARQAFLLTGGGALAMVLGLVLLGQVTAQANGQDGFIFELTTILSTDTRAFVEHPYYTVIALLIMLGAFTKSAQFPFHFWLPNAMSAPTPASAYLHSATMVKAGIYLLARLYPPLHAHDFWTFSLVIIGSITLFVGAWFALTKRDLKGLLAYLTVSTLGAIVALIGLPDYEGMKAAILMIVAHALYKAPLFLSVGSIEHNTGTRIIDELGDMRRYMPRIAWVVGISVLSMAGMFPFFGFVAKEVFLDAFVHWDSHLATTFLLIIAIAATFTVSAGLIMLYEVFFKPASAEIHFHESSKWLEVTPILLAIGSVLFSVFVIFDIVLKPLLQTIVPKTIKLYLLPPDGFANPAFQISTLALGLGAGLFLVRRLWLGWVSWSFIPQGTVIFKGVLDGITWIGNQVVKTQNGQIRYYLVVIMATLAVVLMYGGQLASVFEIAINQIPIFAPTSETFFKAVILVLMCVVAVYSAATRNHLNAALALGLVGYSIGIIFLLEPAPDVALVQFLVETLATILIIVMLGRISARQRQDVRDKLWEGRLKLDNKNVGFIRDLFIAGSVGVVVFVFTLSALATRVQAPIGVNEQAFCNGVVNNDDDTLVRSSIVIYHICNTERMLGVTDVVGAVVTDYRGMDTVIEIGVFATAALGVLTLLTRGLQLNNPLSPQQSKTYFKDEFEQDRLGEVQDATDLSSPFTRLVVRVVLLLGFVVAFAHINFGGNAPGDGFTAGAFLGLATALWFVVYGYREARRRLSSFRPYVLLRFGLLIAVVNGAIPMLNNGAFLGYVNYGKSLGIDGLLSDFSLKFSSTLVFEIAIFLTVFGGILTIMEAIAHPKEASDLGGNDD